MLPREAQHQPPVADQLVVASTVTYECVPGAVEAEAAGLQHDPTAGVPQVDPGAQCAFPDRQLGHEPVHSGADDQCAKNRLEGVGCPTVGVRGDPQHGCAPRAAPTLCRRKQLRGFDELASQRRVGHREGVRKRHCGSAVEHGTQPRSHPPASSKLRTLAQCRTTPRAEAGRARRSTVTCAAAGDATVSSSQSAAALSWDTRPRASAAARCDSGVDGSA